MAGRLEGFVAAAMGLGSIVSEAEAEVSAFTGNWLTALPRSLLTPMELLGVNMAESMRRLMLPPFSS